MPNGGGNDGLCGAGGGVDGAGTLGAVLAAPLTGAPFPAGGLLGACAFAAPFVVAFTGGLAAGFTAFARALGFAEAFFWVPLGAGLAARVRDAADEALALLGISRDRKERPRQE
jgi:hypothetical protein